MKIFIPGNVPSLKNSKVATSRGIFFSKTVRKYLQSLGVKNYSVRNRTVENYKTRPNLFEEAVRPMRECLANVKPPHLIGFYFVRKTRRKFDLMNAGHIIFDLLVAHKVLEDDSCDFLIPVPIQINGKWYTVDKEKPGTYLFILSEKNMQGLSIKNFSLEC